MKQVLDTAPTGLLPLRQAAAFLTLSVRTTMALAHSGKLPFIRVSARRIAFALADLQGYVARRRQ